MCQAIREPMDSIWCIRAFCLEIGEGVGVAVMRSDGRLYLNESSWVSEWIQSGVEALSIHYESRQHLQISQFIV